MAVKSRSGVIVDAVIGDLEGRSGFDGWWGDIDETTQREIRVELAEKVEAILRRRVYRDEADS